MRRYILTTLLPPLLSLAILSPSFAAEEAVATAAAATPELETEVAAGDGLDHARTFLVSGARAQARAALTAFVATTPPSPRRNEAWLELARLELDAGDATSALLAVRSIPKGERSPSALVLEGMALIGTGAAGEGEVLLRAIAPVNLNPDDRVRRRLALADVEILAGNPAAALDHLAEALPQATPEQLKPLLQLAHRLIHEQLTPRQLEEAAGRMRGTPLGADLDVALARRALARNETVRARLLLDGVLDSEIPYLFRREALELRDRLADGVWLRRAIGAVLPLSGKFATFGAAVRRGMELARDENTGPRVALVLRDAGSEGADNAAAVDTLVDEERVMAVVGPLTGLAAAAAAERAEAKAVPLVSLSAREALPETGPYTFRSALTARQQVEALAHHAVTVLGLKRVAVLFPENRQGEELAELFTKAVTERGGRVVASRGYGDNANDFRTPIKLLKGENPALPDKVEKGSKRHKRKEKAPKPKLPFDVLFLPDIAERIALVAPQLAFYGVEGVQLLGPSGWNEPELLRQVARFVEGGIFVDGFYRDSNDPAVQSFVARYRARYGDDPGILEAQSYDVARLLQGLLGQEKIRTRAELRAALEAVRDYPGISGRISVTPSGEFERVLPLLAWREGNVVEVAPAGTQRE